MRNCEWCGETITDLPQSAYATSKPPTVYCDDDCELAHRYHKRRDLKGTLWWTHECPECDQPMFTTPKKDGWWCPECNLEEPIDKSGLRYLEDQTPGEWLTYFDRDCPNPDCDSWIRLFDGAVVCYDCEVYITQYGQQWWAMIEQEYPPKYTDWNDRPNTKQDTLQG